MLVCQKYLLFNAIFGIYVGFQGGIVPWKIPWCCLEKTKDQPSINRRRGAAASLPGPIPNIDVSWKTQHGRLSDIATENTTWAFKKVVFSKENLIFQRNPGWLTIIIWPDLFSGILLIFQFPIYLEPVWSDYCAWHVGWNIWYRELEHEGYIIMGYALLPLRVTTQDDTTLLVRDPELNLHLPPLLGGGHTQSILPVVRSTK